MTSRLSLTLRIDADGHKAIGWGKVKLLKTLEHTGSIAAASRDLGISYRKIRLLVDDLNQIFVVPLIVAVRGGGATITEEGRQLVALYEKMQKNVYRATKTQRHVLEALLAPKKR